jgi:hypothetical protein
LAKGLENIDLAGSKTLCEKAAQFIVPESVVILGDANLKTANIVHKIFPKAKIVVIDRDPVKRENFKGDLDVYPTLIQNFDFSVLPKTEGPLLIVAKNFFHFLPEDVQAKVLSNVASHGSMVYASEPPTEVKKTEKIIVNSEFKIFETFSIGFLGILGTGWGITGKKDSI